MLLPFFFFQPECVSFWLLSQSTFYGRVTAPKFETRTSQADQMENPRTCHAVSTRCRSSNATRLAKYSQGNWKNKMSPPLKLTNKAASEIDSKNKTEEVKRSHEKQYKCEQDYWNMHEALQCSQHNEQKLRNCTPGAVRSAETVDEWRLVRY